MEEVCYPPAPDVVPQTTLDGKNTIWSNDGQTCNGQPLMWKTSVPHYQPSGKAGDRLPNTWHWPEKAR